MNLHDRLKKMEEELRDKSAAIERAINEKMQGVERRLKETHSRIAGVDTPQGVRPFDVARLLSQNQRIDISSEQSLTILDKIMDADFELRHYLGGSMAAYPTTYCETVREYVEPIIDGIPMSDAQREQLLEEIEQAAENGTVIPTLSSLGVHIPGVGCFINGWYLARGNNAMTPAEYFRSPEGFARIVTTASHEKWGHGFVSELTALGQEKKSVQLGMYHLADQFEVSTVDTPDHARLSEQWEILFFGSNFVEEGFATWIERYLAEQLAEREPVRTGLLRNAPAFKAADIIDALRRSPNGAEAAKAVQELFYSEEASLDSVHATMSRVAELTEVMGEGFIRAVGLPAPYAIGYCIVDTTAERQGPKCAPYAIATACNIQYGLGTISNHDLRNYVRSQPNLNPNTRLALIMFLSEGDRDDVATFLTRVRDQLGLTPPVG